MMARPGRRSGCRTSLATLFAILLLSSPRVDAIAADTAASAPPPRAQEVADGAPVTLFNREVTVLRAPFFGVSATDRARRTEGRLDDILARGGPGTVTVRREPQGDVLSIDGS